MERRETGGRPNLGSLLIGYYQAGKLIYAGSVGTGWSVQVGRSIVAALQRISRETSPFVAVPQPDAKDAHWAEPQLGCEVEFITWRRDGRVRRAWPMAHCRRAGERRAAARWHRRHGARTSAALPGTRRETEAAHGAAL